MLLFVSLINLWVCQANLPFEEQLALKEFYNAMNGKYWKNCNCTTTGCPWNETLFNGSFSCDFNWCGLITLNLTKPQPQPVIYNKTCAVSSISFGTNISNTIVNNVRGTVPPSISYLTQLHIFIIRDNDNHKNSIYGTLPQSFTTLQSLKRLILYGNLTIKNDTNLCEFEDLTYLSLNSSILDVKIEEYFNECNWTNFVTFHLSNVQKLHGNISNMFCDFGARSRNGNGSLYLSNITNIFGTIPTCIFRRKRKTKLYLFGMTDLPQINGIIPNEICKGIKSHLLIMNTAIYGKIPSCIQNLTSLETLGLSGNKLHGTIPTLNFC